MESTEKLLEAKELWGGLCIGNGADAISAGTDAVVFGIAHDANVSYREGAADGPRAIRESSLPIPPTTEVFEDMRGWQVVDLGDFSGPDTEEVFRRVEDRVADLVSRDQFFTMIGGDHSVTIPVLRGIDRAIDHPFGIIHIDAHFDLCDQIDGNPLSHGSTERRALELEHVEGAESLFFIGVRSIELEELSFIEKHPVHVVNAATFEKMGTESVIEKVRRKMGHFESLYLTIDIDALDPGFAAGTGTPKFGGLSARQLLDLLRGLFELPIIGFDVVEVAPELDPAKTSVYAGQRIITECWGHQMRKQGRFE
jgi:agmatinase